MPPKEKPGEKKADTSATGNAQVQSIWNSSLNDINWKTFVCMVSVDTNPQTDQSNSKGKKSDDGQSLITSFYDAVASGIRQRFRVLSKQDIINWALENKTYDVSALIKAAVDAAGPTGEINPMAIAKALKTMMLVTKREVLTEKGIYKSLDSLTKKDSRPASAAASAPAPPANTAPPAAAAAATANTKDPKKGGKKDARAKVEAKPILISDEPEKGPDVYYILRDVVSVGFINAATEIKLLPNSVIRLTQDPATPQNTIFASLRNHAFTKVIGVSAWKNISFTTIAVDNLWNGMVEGKNIFDQISKHIYSLLEKKSEYDKIFGKARIVEVMGAGGSGMDKGVGIPNGANEDVSNMSTTTNALAGLSPPSDGASDPQSQISKKRPGSGSSVGITDLRYYNSILDGLPSSSCIGVEMVVAALVEQVTRSLENAPATGNLGAASSNITKSTTAVGMVGIQEPPEDWALISNYFDKVMSKYTVTGRPISAVNQKRPNSAKTANSNNYNNESPIQNDAMEVIRAGDELAERGISFGSVSNSYMSGVSPMDHLRRIQNNYSTSILTPPAPTLSNFMSKVGRVGPALNFMPSLEFHVIPTSGSSNSFYGSTLETQNANFTRPFTKSLLNSGNTNTGQLNHLYNISMLSQPCLDRNLIQLCFEDMLNGVHETKDSDGDIDDDESLRNWNLSQWCFEEPLDANALAQRLQSQLYSHPRVIHQVFEDKGIRLVALLPPSGDKKDQSSEILTKTSSFQVKSWLGFGFYLELLERNPQYLKGLKSSKDAPLEEYFYDTCDRVLGNRFQTQLAYPQDGSQIRVVHKNDGKSFRHSDFKSFVLFQDKVFTWSGKEATGGSYFHANLGGNCLFSARPNSKRAEEQDLCFSLDDGTVTRVLPNGAISVSYPINMIRAEEDAHLDVIVHRTIHSDGSVMLFFKDERVKVLSIDGQTTTYSKNGSELIVTNIDGSMFKQLKSPTGSVTTEQLPAIQQISQYFAENRQTVLTRGDLMVTTFSEDLNSDNTSPAYVTTDYPDGTKIMCKFDSRKVDSILGSFKNRTKSLISNPENIKKLMTEAIQTVQVYFNSSFSAYFDASLGLTTIEMKPDLAIKLWLSEKSVKLVEIIKMDGSIIVMDKPYQESQSFRVRFKVPSYPTFNCVYAFVEQKHKHSAINSDHGFGSHLLFKDDKRLVYEVSLESGKLKVFSKNDDASSQEIVQFKIDINGRLRLATKESNLRSMADISAAVEQITSSMSVMDLSALNTGASDSGKEAHQNNQITRILLAKDFPAMDPFPGTGPRLFVIRSDGSGIEFHRDIDLIPFTKEIIRDQDAHIIEQSLGQDSGAYSITFIRKKINPSKILNEEYLVFRQLVYRPPLTDDQRLSFHADIKSCEDWAAKQEKASDALVTEPSRNHFMNSVLDNTAVQSAQAVSTIANTINRDIMRKYHQVELTKKAQMELQIRTKRKIIDKAKFEAIVASRRNSQQRRVSLVPGASRMESAAGRKSTDLMVGTISRGIMMQHKVNPLWKKYHLQELALQKGETLKYFDSDAGQEFLAQQAALEAATRAPIKRKSTVIMEKPRKYHDHSFRSNPALLTLLENEAVDEDLAETCNPGDREQEQKAFDSLGIRATSPTSKVSKEVRKNKPSITPARDNDFAARKKSLPISPTQLVVMKMDYDNLAPVLTPQNLPQIINRKLSFLEELNSVNVHGDGSLQEPTNKVSRKKVSIVAPDAIGTEADADAEVSATFRKEVVKPQTPSTKPQPLTPVSAKTPTAAAAIVKIPSYLRSGTPNRVDNERYKAIDEPVRRKIHTSSVAKASIINQGVLLVHPTTISFGVLCQGGRYRTEVHVTNVGWDIERFKAAFIDPPNHAKQTRLLSFHCRPGPLAAGITATITIDIEATLPNVINPKYIYNDLLEIRSEKMALTVPIKAEILRYGDYEVLKKKTAAQKKISAADTILHNPHVRPIVDQAGGLGERKDAPDIDELY